MWVKKGLIYSESHAQLPTVEVCDDVLRIYFSTKENNVSQINYIEVDKNNPKDVLYKNSSPILGPGIRGCFDDCGVMPSSIVTTGNIKFLYYTGWNKDKGDVPYGHGIGVAVTRNSPKVFERLHQGPHLDRCIDEPFLCNSACVVGDYIYYCSGTGWQDNFPLYQIACRKNWSQKKVCLDNKNEMAMSRPCVRDNQMWFAHRTKDTPYQIGYAEYDGLKWIMMDSGLDKSDAGWDSEMVCYPWVTGKYMLYNGNGYGATGIGYAEWK